MLSNTVSFIFLNIILFTYPVFWVAVNSFTCVNCILFPANLEKLMLVHAEQKQDESLLEDVWTLLRAGRLEEACELCRSAGQVCSLELAITWD